MAAAGEKTPLKPAGGASGGENKFSSKAGILVTCLGCAVGTGNIWRFPRMVALNSGKEGALCFMLPWLLFLLMWSLPMVIIEYGVGRFTGTGVVTSIQRLGGDRMVWAGLWIVFVNFMIGCWYHVIMGWCIFYTYQVTFNPLPRSVTESYGVFQDSIVDSYWPVLTQAIGIFITGLLMLKGIRMIERANMVMIPLLLLLIVILFIWSLTRDGALAGLKFFFTPDWATLANARLWVDAASQNAFDCGAGWGQFIAFASVMQATDPVVKFAIIVPICNNIVSLLCGMLTFSTAFASLHSETNGSTTHIVDILQQSGPAGTGLTFIWLPVLFATAHTAGRVFAVIFFVSLVLAALSSMIGTLENVIQVLINYGVSRPISVVVVVMATFVGGLGSSMNMEYLTNQDFTWAFALILSGVVLQVTVIRYGTARFRKDMFQAYSDHDWVPPVVWEWFVKFVAPLQAAGLMTWWVVDTALTTEQGHHHWYEFSSQTLLPVLLQWLLGLLLLVVINVVLLHVRPGWFLLHSPSTGHSLLEDKPGDVDGPGKDVGMLPLPGADNMGDIQPTH